MRVGLHARRVVHLPRDRVLVTGDLLLPAIPFGGDGYFAEWPETLEKIEPATSMSFSRTWHAVPRQ